MPHDPKHQMLHARPNVQVIWQIYASLQLGDIPTVFGLFSPEIELLQSEEVPWGGAYRGHEGAQEFFDKLTRHVTTAVLLERFIDSGDHVIAIGRTQGTVNATGVAFDVPISHVWTLKDGLVVQARYCIDHPTMLKALAQAAE
jgi:ketosteroid isomerase-like protein